MQVGALGCGVCTNNLFRGYAVAVLASPYLFHGQQSERCGVLTRHRRTRLAKTG